MHKTENCLDGANAANDPRKITKELAIPTNEINKNPLPNSAKIAAPTFTGKSRQGA